MNEEQAYDLSSRLENTQVSFRVQDTNTGVIIEIPVNVLTAMMEDPSFGADQMPLLRNLLSSQIFIETGRDEGVLMVPSFEDDILYYGMQYIKNRQILANQSMRIIPDDPSVFDSLTRVFKGTLESSSEYFDDGEIHFQLKPGRYAVDVGSGTISFWNLDENDRVITDSGVQFSFYTP